jgi:DNA-binding NarL/FixJ family response regulator
MSIRLLLADDHQLMRQGLKALILEEAGMEIVGEADNGKEVVALAVKLRPHIVIMDIAMPGLNGIEATRQIINANPQTKVIALSGHDSTQFVREMLSAGASAYLLKKRAYEELTQAIREVMKGKKFLSPDVTQGVMDAYVKHSSLRDEKPAFVMLTDREREVLQRLAEGHATKETADTLSVSVKTVETHRRNIMEKLNLHSIAELTKYAVREGLTGL